ncbi:MAG: S8 family serine peptidase, partial [Planctomycetota bacterium]
MRSAKTALSLTPILLVLFCGLAAAQDDLDVIVGFTGDPDETVFLDHGGTPDNLIEGSNAVSGRIPASAIPLIRSLPNVAFVEEDAVFFVTAQTMDWGVNRIDADLAWTYTTGYGAKVGINDTGIDLDHPDLEPHIAGGVNYVNSNSPDDDNGHGTHCAGIVGAMDNTSDTVGVAPDCTLYALKSMNSGGSGSSSDIAACVDWARTNGLDVVSMSVGGTSFSQSFKDTCQDAWNAGLILVGAAGNSNSSSPHYPSGYDSVISVSSTTSSDNKSSFSNYGTTIELAAPGSSILASRRGGGTTTKSGTSMACPHVAGVAALGFACGLYADNAEIRQAMIDFAEDLGAAGWDQYFGHGLVDAEALVDGAPPQNRPPQVNAGADQVLLVPDLDTDLDATVTDDGRPDPPASYTLAWTKVSGPGTVTFGDAAAEDTTVSFSEAGAYVLQLEADDSELQETDTVKITITEALVGHWTLDESSGTRSDSSGNGNDLADHSTVGSAAGKVGNAASFNGTSEYLDISDANQTGLDAAGALTLAAWISADSTSDYR